MNLRRKRLRLMRDTQWRGYLRTATGNPITLDNTLSVSNLTVQGNGAQGGMPSGELQDNGMYKVSVTARGRNLIDYTKSEPRISGQTIEVIENGVKWSGNYYFQIPVKNLIVGKTYSLTFKNDIGGFWNIRYNDGTNSANIQNKNSIKILKEVSYIYIYKSKPEVFENDMIITDICLYEGTYTSETLPPYEPYKEPRTINIYTPKQINIDDYIVIDVDNKTATLQVDNVNTDITPLQDFTQYNLTGTWILTAIGDVPPSSLTAEYYSNERSTE